MLRGAQKLVHFATAGDKGSLRLWRSDTAACVAEVPPEVAIAGSAACEYTDLSLLPGGGGLLAATADARLLFYAPKVRMQAAGGFVLLEAGAAHSMHPGPRATLLSLFEQGRACAVLSAHPRTCPCFSVLNGQVVPL